MASDPTAAIDLRELARGYNLSPALALGLGAGLYFEYTRRPDATPTRHISGLNHMLPAALAERRASGLLSSAAIQRRALVENARWFNLDRAPTTGLLGMEMLAEELAYFYSLPDAALCLEGMAAQIKAQNALARRIYADFLRASSGELAEVQPLAQDLVGIAEEWDIFGEQLAAAAASVTEAALERASRMLRRLALREEHFWGSVLD